MSPTRLDMPNWFQFEVTNRCNFNCAMCPRNLLKIEIRDMPYDLYRRLLQRVPAEGLVSLLGLGEPLLHKRIMDMVRLAKQRGNSVSITTNGSLLDDEKRQEILDSGLDYLRFSIDSIKPIEASSAHLVANTVLENARAMAELRGNAAQPHLMFNTVVSTDTHQGIAEVIRKAREIGFDAVNLIRLARNTPVVHRLSHDVEEKLFPEYHQLGEEIGIEVRSTYTKRDRKFRYCPLRTSYIYINLYGDVTPCCHLPERAFAVGNLLQEPLRDIWLGDKLRRFWKKQFPKVCADCTLMTWYSPEEQRARKRQQESMAVNNGG